MYSGRQALERPDLFALGIPSFGHYSVKKPFNQIACDSHGSAYEVCYLESGMQPYFIHPDPEGAPGERKIFRLYGGEVFVTFPHQFHSSGPFYQQRGSLYWIQLDSECPTFLNQTPEVISLLRETLAGFKRHLIRPPASIVSRLPEAYRLAGSEDRENIARACSLLTLFVFELAEFNRQIEGEIYRYGSLTKLGKEAVTFISDNLLSPALDVGTIASHLNYSRAHLMTSFKKEIGLTVHEFIIRSKIEYACDLMAEIPVTEVALMLNFSSSQHFSNVFKAYTGMTPTQYIKSLRQIPADMERSF